MDRRITSPVGILGVGIWMRFCMLCTWFIGTIVWFLPVRIPVPVVVVVRPGDRDRRVVWLGEEVVVRPERSVGVRDCGV